MSDENKPAGFITITVPYTEETSGFRAPRPYSGTRDTGEQLVGAVRDRKAVLLAAGDIAAAVLAAWPLGRELTDRAKRLAEAAEIQGAIGRNIYGWPGDLGKWAERGGLRLLLREIREADGALATLGLPDDGRPLAERIAELGERLAGALESLHDERRRDGGCECGYGCPSGCGCRSNGDVEDATPAVRPEPLPIATGSAPIWPMVIADVAGLGAPARVTAALVEDMRARDAQGRERYKTPLTADNGRNHFVDGYQELLDGAVYLRAEIESDGPMTKVATQLYPIVLSALASACAAMRTCEHRKGGEATPAGTCADCGVDFADLEHGDGDPREGPMHDWFELSRASHLALPRVVIQSMSRLWQAQLVGLLDQADVTCAAAGVVVESNYYVRALDGEGRFTDEELPHYRHAPLLGDPAWATAPRPVQDEDDPVEKEREEATEEAFTLATRLIEGLKGKAVATPEEMRQAALVALTTRSIELAELVADPARRAAFNAPLDGQAPRIALRSAENRGAFVRVFRAEHGITAAHLATALRITETNVWHLEEGTRTTDDAGWLEITTTLFRLGAAPKEKRAEEAGYIADPMSRPGLDRLLADAEEDVDVQPAQPPPEPDEADQTIGDVPAVPGPSLRLIASRAFFDLSEEGFALAVVIDEATETKSAASSLVRRSEMVRRVARDLRERDGDLNDAILALDGINLDIGFGLARDTTEQGVAVAARAAVEAASKAIAALQASEGQAR